MATAAPTLKAALRAAKEALGAGDAAAALRSCKEALKADKGSYDAYVLAGKAAHLLGERQQAAAAYKRAAGIADGKPAAWQGLAALHEEEGTHGELVVVLRKLAELAGDDAPRRTAFLQRLVCAARAAGDEAAVSGAARDVLAIADAPADARRDALRVAAATSAVREIGAADEAASAALAAALAPGAAAAPAVPRYPPGVSMDTSLDEILDEIAAPGAADPADVPFLVLRLRRGLAYTTAASDASAALLAVIGMLDAVAAALEAPESLVDAALEVAVTCAEALEAYVGREEPCMAEDAIDAIQSVGKKVEDLVRSLAAAAPSNALAPVLATFLDSAASRAPVVKALTARDGAAAGSVLGWVTVAESASAGGAPPKEVLEATQRGLRCVGLRATALGGVLPRAERRLRLLAAEALVEATPGSSAAERALRALLPGTRPVQALASVLEAQGKLAEAVEMLEAAVERWPSAPGPRARLGRVMFERGELDRAREMLETAVAGAGAGPVAEAHFWLGRVYMALGGTVRSDRSYAHASFLASAGVAGALQGAAFAWLGHLYAEEFGDRQRAASCWKRALELDPTQASAGEALCGMLTAAGKPDAVSRVCRSAWDRSPRAVWAARRLAESLAAAGDHDEAIRVLQGAIRGDPEHAATWEALGSSYHACDRYTAAIKAHSRALELDPTLVLALCERGTVRYTMGERAECAEDFARALELQPGFDPARLGLANALLSCAHADVRRGAFKRCASELERAAEAASAAAEGNGTLLPAWKTLADVRLAQAVVPTPPPGAGGGDGDLCGHALASVKAKLGASRVAARSYAHAVHLDPSQALLWADVASARLAEATARRTHSAAEPQAAPKADADAARLLFGAIQVDPLQPDLWAALARALPTQPQKEAALSRALALAPTHVLAWARLGELYLSGGPRSLPMAEKALEHARQADPSSDVAWTATARLHAALGRDADALSSFQMASQLGGGGAADLGFARAAVAAGRAGEGPVYAAASRAAAALPYSPTAQAVLAAAAEARGLLDVALARLSAAAALLDEAEAQQASCLFGATLDSSCVVEEGLPALRDAVRAALERVGGKLAAAEEEAPPPLGGDARALARAVHACPGSPALQARLQVVAGASPRAALRLAAVALRRSPGDAGCRATHALAAAQAADRAGTAGASRAAVRALLGAEAVAGTAAERAALSEARARAEAGCRRDGAVPADVADAPPDAVAARALASEGDAQAAMQAVGPTTAACLALAATRVASGRGDAARGVLGRASRDPVSLLMLAEVEASRGAKGDAQERASAAAAAAWRAWPQGAARPAELFAACGASAEAAGKSPPVARWRSHAVHAQPSSQARWTLLPQRAAS